MLKRLLYTVLKAPQYRQQLGKIKQQPAVAPTQISLKKWQEQGIETIIFDFDGVLAAHGEKEPDTTTVDLLQQSLDLFGQHHVFILSNKPSPIRASYFAKHFPHIQFIRGSKKKPYPNGIETIIELSHSKAEKVLLIDDRLLTGALAACISGIQCQYISNPLMNINKRPVVERFFQSLRIFERFLL